MSWFKWFKQSGCAKFGHNWSIWIKSENKRVWRFCYRCDIEEDKT